jgi:hypothetical protein
VSAAALVVYAVALAVVLPRVWRRPLLGLELWIVGLALHNAVMAGLFAAHVRGTPLTVVQSWKELVLAVALARVCRDALRDRRLPFRPGIVDWLALAVGVLVLAYSLVPQHVLGGSAGPKAIAYAVRHDLVPVAAYFLGRSLVVDRAGLRRIGVLIVGTAAAVAAIGILDDYFVSISWWRDSAVPRYFRDQLGFAYHGTGNADPTLTLPENFIFNLGTDTHFLRRLVSTFLSPLAASYLFVAGLLVCAVAAWRRGVVAVSALLLAGLLLTYTRSAILVLPVALLVVALLLRRTQLAAVAVVALGAGLAWSHVYPHVAPQGHWTKADIVRQHAAAAKAHTSGSQTGASSCGGESSFCSHWHSLKGGVRSMVDHPEGYGLGNAGETASRNAIAPKAGESTYTEAGAETGLAGALLWTAWGIALLLALVRATLHGPPEWRTARAVATAGVLAVLALALQTDVVGDPWLAYVTWGLAGLLLPRGGTVQA